VSNNGTSRIKGDNPVLQKLEELLRQAAGMPAGSDVFELARTLEGLPDLPDRFNAAFLEHGWIYVEFACGYEAAGRALTMKLEGAEQRLIDEYLTAHLLAFEPIKWQALKLLGGGMAEPRYPVRAEFVKRVFQAYDTGDHMIVAPLILMLVDGFGVSETGTKSMFTDIEDLNHLFQSLESVAGHPTALRSLLEKLRKGQRGYSEAPLTMPLRNGILHGTRLNYADPAVSAKSLNLLAAVVEWARDIAPEPKDEASKRAWNAKFLAANLARLDPDSPEKALILFQAAVDARRFTDVVALIDYHPVLTLLSEKIGEWQELDVERVTIECTSEWEIFGNAQDREQNARCQVSVTIGIPDGSEIAFEKTLFVRRPAQLAEAGLPSVWQIELGFLGAIRRQLRQHQDSL
jgi:hypothetical protein